VSSTNRFGELAEASWAWVLGQVRYDDGPWIPASVPAPEDKPTWDRDGMHSGIGGLALVLAEIRLARPWTDAEAELAAAIADRVTRQIPTTTDPAYFDGLVSIIGTLTALEAPGADLAVARLTELTTDDGWPQTIIGAPRYVDGGVVNDLTLGTAGVLLGAVWAARLGVAGARDLACIAADLLVPEADDLPDGLDWPFLPVRYLIEPPDVRMPNFSHGTAGIATALALAGLDLGRPDLVEAAARGASYLGTLGDRSDGGFILPRRLPVKEGEDEFTFTWCHGPTGTSTLYPALAAAGVTNVLGESVANWRSRCLTSVRASGIPERRYPGFWDNDGRCCGTAGVADVMFDAGEIEFGLSLCQTLVERAVTTDNGAYWQFIEHKNDDPLLPPGVGWMQGTAGIAAVLFRGARLAEDPTAPPLRRLDNFWCVDASN